MASDGPGPNPYAPPQAELEATGGGGATFAATALPDAAQIAAALARLKEHVASQANVAADLAAAGGLLRPVTIVFVLLAVLSVLGVMAAALTMGPGGSAAIPFAGGLTAVVVVVAIALLALDIQLGRRDAAATPDLALKRYLRAFRMGRNGYAWAFLSPTARGQTVATPALGPIKVGAGTFAMSSPDGLKGYAGTFARPGQGQVRTMQAKSATVRNVSGDVAIVDVELLFHAWPRWISIALGVSVVVMRLLAIVAVVLMFVLRKKYRVTVSKILLQGQPGVWYAFDANVLERPAGSGT